jgi:lysophospholipase L1-like esterase
MALLAVALALGATGCGSDDDDTEPLSDHLVVSIGDSVASGEGNPDRPASLVRRAGWKNRQCHRSLGSGHALAAMQVLGSDQRGRLVLLGCSGAAIEKGLLEPYRGIQPPPDDRPQPPQVERLGELAADHEIDAVLLSIGGNDLGFIRFVEFCILHTSCPTRRFDPEPGEPGPLPALKDYVPQALDQLADRYVALNDALAEVVPPDRVIVVEYFDPTSAPADAPPDIASDGDCRMFLGLITPAESRWAREQVLQPLNDQIHESAEEFGWQVVEGVDEEFAGHGLCAGRERYVTTARESVFGQGISLGDSLLDRQAYRELLASYKGTLHPNPAGHRATAELIAPVLADLVDGSEPADSSAG